MLTEGEPRADGDAEAKLLGTTKRDDPKGEVLCQNVEEFGGLWLVLDASGEALS